MSYTITLGDGSKIENLSLNGNNFISKTKLTADNFKDLSKVVITDENGKEEEHGQMELVQIVTVGRAYWFVLRDLSAQELEKIALQAQLDTTLNSVAELTEMMATMMSSTN